MDAPQGHGFRTWNAQYCFFQVPSSALSCCLRIFRFLGHHVALTNNPWFGIQNPFGLTRNFLHIAPPVYSRF
jgi:hypothetical protein